MDAGETPHTAPFAKGEADHDSSSSVDVAGVADVDAAVAVAAESSTTDCCVAVVAVV